MASSVGEYDVFASLYFDNNRFFNEDEAKKSFFKTVVNSWEQDEEKPHVVDLRATKVQDLYKKALDSCHTDVQRTLFFSDNLYGCDLNVVLEDFNKWTEDGTSDSENDLNKKEPSSKRLQRWDNLNQILSAKKSKNKDSTAYSNVTWSEVKDVFNLVDFEQERPRIKESHLAFFSKYLSMTTKVFGKLTTGKEAKRLHFIAPILICVCFLLDGKVGIVAEEDLNGSRLQAHGHFEFMITHESKAVCIVEAKKDDIEQGMAQGLLGCEVAAEVGGLDVVCGIVTNYIQWNFYRSFDDRVEMEECSMDLTPNGPEPASLKKIAEKIYGMLKVVESE